MLSVLGQSFLGGLLMIYLAFIIYSIWGTLETKLTKDTPRMGVFVYYHGMAWIGMLCLTTAGGLTFVFTTMLNAFIGGI